MKSVRLRILVLTLLPLIVLMPLLLILAMTRWTSDYDDVLIAKVESDLRIAEQYLGQIMDDTGAGIMAAAESAGIPYNSRLVQPKTVNSLKKSCFTDI